MFFLCLLWVPVILSVLLQDISVPEFVVVVVLCLCEVSSDDEDRSLVDGYSIPGGRVWLDVKNDTARDD